MTGIRASARTRAGRSGRLAATVAAAIAIGLGLGACREQAQHPPVPDAAAPYVDAVATRLEGRERPPILTPDQERCVAGSIVSGMTLEAIAATGLTPEELATARPADLAPVIATPQHASAIAEGIVGCGLGGKFAGLLASHELADRSDDDDVQKVIDCIGTDIDAAAQRTIIAAYFFGRPTDNQRTQVRDLVIDCGFDVVEAS